VELPKITQVISGGAGAPLYGKAENAEEFNPHSEVYEMRLHYCLFEVDGDECTMQAIDTNGVVFDTRTWEARE